MKCAAQVSSGRDQNFRACERPVSLIREGNSVCKQHAKKFDAWEAEGVGHGAAMAEFWWSWK